MPTTSTSFRVRVLSKALVIGFLVAIGVVLLFAWLAEEVNEGETLRFDEHGQVEPHAHGHRCRAQPEICRMRAISEPPRHSFLPSPNQPNRAQLSADIKPRRRDAISSGASMSPAVNNVT